ncbi:MAG: hypothetical protein HKN33_06585 [Pyrinomonadaceae bacterium]|nr:hypothetical protein [Pyrinomonadaceae bacterium]
MRAKPKKRVNRSGFRAFEVELYRVQLEFIHRLVRKYPDAIKDLKDLLPLSESVFGSSQEMNLQIYNNAGEFDRLFLLPPEKLLAEFHLHHYRLRYYRRETDLPEFVSMPTGHTNEGNEKHYRVMFESSLIRRIAKLRSRIRNDGLHRYLKETEALLRKCQQEHENILRSHYCERNVNITDTQIWSEARDQVDILIEKTKVFEKPEIKRTLEAFWVFYEKFHDWLAKYYLQKDWLRRSFFFMLLNGVQGIIADVGSLIYLPQELQRELFGVEFCEGIYRDDIPSPKPFSYGPKNGCEGKEKTTMNRSIWEAEAFSLFESPTSYEESEIERFSGHLEKNRHYKIADDILDAASDRIAKLSSYSDGTRDPAKDFCEYLNDFYLFKEIAQEREATIASLRKHIKEYLEKLLPKIGKYYDSRAGRPPNFDRIDWLLYSNVENADYGQTIEALRLGGEKGMDESTVRKAFVSLEEYDLPVRKRTGSAPVWQNRTLIEYRNRLLNPEKTFR